MGKTPEAKVRDPVVTWARKNGLGHIRMSFRPGVRQATPDDLFLGDGRAAWVEFKRPGKEPTPLQWDRIHWLRSLGFDAEWFDDTDAAIRWLSEIFG